LAIELRCVWHGFGLHPIEKENVQPFN